MDYLDYLGQKADNPVTSALRVQSRDRKKKMSPPFLAFFKPVKNIPAVVALI